jgi:uncharacterized protein (DUF924 family)
MSPEALLAFWFGDACTSADAARARGALWFGRSADFDRALSERFGALPERAAGGGLAAWEREPRSRLALVLALDQLPRNLFRDDAKAFAFDAAALRAALTGLARGDDAALHPLEAAFLYLPLEHAEDLALQERCVALFEALARRAPPGYEAQLAEMVRFARLHRDLVARFGRFPHRNAALGRESTAAERAYLAAGGERFGQGGGGVIVPA